MNIIREDQRPKEIQASSVAINQSGSLGLFCGLYEILLLSFDDPKRKRKESINKSSDPVLCQWNKTCNEYFALTQSNVCKIFDIELKKFQSLKAHNKIITSIDWHPDNKNQIATSSNENNKSLCIWDIRNSKFPSHKIDSQGIQQVKWSKMKTNLLATTYNGEIIIWDDRKLSVPTHNLGSHNGDINDFDWSLNLNIIVSCGQDKKLKIWNLEESNQNIIMEEDYANYSMCKFDSLDNIFTLTSSDVPSENFVSFWSITDFHNLCSTPPNTNIITDFDLIYPTNAACQFATLHRNSDFKIWELNKSFFSGKRKRGGSSHAPGLDSSISNDRLFLSPSPDHSANKSKAIPVGQSESFVNMHKNEILSSIMVHHSDPNLIMREKSNKSLSEDQEIRVREFDKLSNTNQVTFEKSVDMRSVTAHFSLINLKCSIQFIYRTSIGDIVFLDVIVLRQRAEKIRPQNLEELEKILKTTIDDCRRNNILPIEKCVDVTLDYLNKLSSRFSLRAIRSLKDPSTPIHSFTSLPDVKVPFPRICGASFSPTGLLVCFLSPEGYMSRFHSAPRSLADISKLANASSSSKGFFYEMNKNTTQKQYYKSNIRKLKSTEFNTETPSRKLSTQSIQKQTHIVLLYNVLQLSLFNLSLANNYSLNISNVEAMCHKNLNAVTNCNRKDLFEFWQYCAILANGCKPSINISCGYIRPWATQSMGRGLCELWMTHFLHINDIQSAAMLVIVMRAIDSDLENNFKENKNNASSISLTSGSHKNISQESLMDNIHSDTIMSHYPMQNYYAAYHPGAITDTGPRITLPGPGRFRNNSFGELEITSNLKRVDNAVPDMSLQHFQQNEQIRLIDPTKNLQYNRILLHYVSILSAHKLLNFSSKIVQKILPVKFFNLIFGHYNFDVFLLRNCINDHRCKSVYIDHNRSTVICSECPTRIVSVNNQDTSKTPFICSVCRNFVRGLFSVCDQCNHGGHADHLNSWFARTGTQVTCPAGCGCVCFPSKDFSSEFFVPISATG